MADERGFTMVELAAVAAIIGVLAAIAMAMFSNATAVANNRAVEAELRSAVTPALVLAGEAGGRFLVDDRPLEPSDLQAEEPNLTFANDGSKIAIGVHLSEDANALRLDKLDRSGTRHTVLAVLGQGLRFCSGGEPADCTWDVPSESSASSTTTITATPKGASSSSSGRQDGGTPASDHRNNGGR